MKALNVLLNQQNEVNNHPKTMFTILAINVRQYLMLNG